MAAPRTTTIAEALDKVRQLRQRLVDADDAPESSVWTLDQVLRIFDAVAPEEPRALVQEWEAAADRAMARALVGDPAAAMATASALRSCAAALRAARSSDLSTAWEAAEAALPEGWRLKGLELGSDWRAYAEPSPAYTRHGRREMWLGIGAHGPTKEAALAALTARLQARSTEPKP